MGEERKTCPSARISKVLSQSLAEKNCFTQTAPVRRTAAAYRSPSAVSVFIKREGAVESVSVKQLCRLHQDRKGDWGFDLEQQQP